MCPKIVQGHHKIKWNSHVTSFLKTIEIFVNMGPYTIETIKKLLLQL